MARQLLPLVPPAVNTAFKMSLNEVVVLSLVGCCEKGITIAECVRVMGYDFANQMIVSRLFTSLRSRSYIRRLNKRGRPGLGSRHVITLGGDNVLYEFEKAARLHNQLMIEGVAEINKRN